MGNLLNEHNFERIIDNAFYAVVENYYDGDNIDAIISDVIAEIRDSIGDAAFDEIVNYEALNKDLERKTSSYFETYDKVVDSFQK